MCNQKKIICRYVNVDMDMNRNRDTDWKKMWQNINKMLTTG